MIYNWKEINLNWDVDFDIEGLVFDCELFGNSAILPYPLLLLYCEEESLIECTCVDKVIFHPNIKFFFLCQTLKESLV